MNSDRYRYTPAYYEGMQAHKEGMRREHNPYAAVGDQLHSLEWWTGWDDHEASTIIED